MYTKELIERVKSAVNIADMISEYQTLTKHGKHWIGVCPFHADSRPSLTVNPAMQIYKCFACGASGDVLSYVQHAESCTFTEALRIVAKRAHIDLPEPTEETEEERKSRLERETQKAKNIELQAEFEKGRAEETFTDYLVKRQISPAAAETFGLGYAVSGEFRGRVTYPIYTVSGQIAGWTGRIVQELGGGPKYKNSAESALFKKDELLFGLLQARQSIQSEDSVFLVEGQNDVIRMWMTGHKNTVAGSGTAFSEKQARLLERFTRNIVLMYDGDAAGRKATLRTLRLLLDMQMKVRVVSLPDGEDPDSWLLSRETRETRESSWIDYLMELYPPVEDATKTSENLKAVLEYVDLCRDSLERGLLVQAIAKTYRVKRGDVEAALTPTSPQPSPKERGKKPERLEGLDALDNLEDLDDLDEEEFIPEIDPAEVPDYVWKERRLRRQYMLYGFYPIRKQDREVAYVFRSEKSGVHFLGSDFWMEALLFVDPGTDHSKRVVRVNHLWGMSQYVEFPSESLITVNDMRKRMFGLGAYNFNGSQLHWDHVRQALSYDFQTCFETRVYGWQTEGFFMFPNGAYYRGEESWQFTPCDELGVVEVDGRKYYSPASSSLRLSGRQEDDPYEQDYLAYYLSPEGKERMEFTEWAGLMDRVFQVNENGKWAVMFAIACSFRDLIYKIVGSFTALCFAGPTGSGKTEIAYGIRGLWMRREAAVFNLNSGSDAAFFIVLEHFRNMPVIMEEYNDNGISQVKFQGLKAAVYDDKGRTKVKDIASKSLDTSKTNAAPILIGQDTPQQDDGSLSNRVIICEVPKKEGGFSLAETEQFERLKKQAELGMGNILLDIVRQRPVFERYFKQYFFEEVARMKEATWDSTTNKDGLERVIRSVAILSATARLVEERCDLRLPWRYAHFYDMAINKIPKQMENIATTSKIGNFFQALNTLLGTGRVLYGRELKVERSWQQTVNVKDGIGLRPVEVGVGTQLLYLHFDSCYSAYCKEVSNPRDVLSKQTLVNYFRSHSAFVGLCKSTRFTWQEAGYAGEETQTGQAGHATMQMQTKTFVSSAYLFNYEVLRELLDIDFQRNRELDNLDMKAQ